MTEPFANEQAELGSLARFCREAVRYLRYLRNPVGRYEIRLMVRLDEADGAHLEWINVIETKASGMDER